MAELLKWDQTKYSVKVDKMDQEHQKLVGYMNVLYDLHQKKAAKPELQKALKDMAGYTVQHFSDEETYFKSVPAYKNNVDAHLKIHKELLTKVTKFVEDFNKPDGKMTEEFFTFLKVWLTAHIGGVDMKYGVAAATAKAS
jgi:hemerythrin-like metal-binding protein